MNILYICDEYPPGKTGGIGTMTQVLARELVRQNHSVYVIGLYSYRYGEKDYENDKGVEVYRLRYGLNLSVIGKNRIYNLYEKMPSFIRKRLNGEKAYYTFLNFVRDFIKNNKIDIIEVPDFSTYSKYIGVMENWPELSIPLIVRLHGSASYTNSELGVYTTKKAFDSDKLLYKRADAISAVSNHVAHKIKNIFQLEEKPTVIYNSINVPEIIKPKEKKLKNVVFAGTLIAQKGIVSLMKAWNLVVEKHPDAELIVYGRGKTKPLEEILSPKSKKTILFKGFAPKEKIIESLSSSILGVFPSYTETFGLTVIEAMSVETPVIYTKRSCGPEIIEHGVNGILVSPDNIEEIADAIITMFENPELRNKMGKNGYETVRKKFNIEDSVHQHIEFYNSVREVFLPEEKVK
jgi:glycogen synthase